MPPSEVSRCGSSRCRLRVVSKFGDSGEIHARAKIDSSEETRHEGRSRIPSWCVSSRKLRMCVYSILSELPKFMAILAPPLVTRMLTEAIFGRACVFRPNLQN